MEKGLFSNEVEITKEVVWMNILKTIILREI